MSAYNKVILIGNLTRDPEVRFSPKGTAIGKMGIAVNRKWQTESGEKKDEVTFIDVTMFGRTAENVAQYMKKGSSILIDGRLQLEQWDDKATGQKRNKLTVVGESVQFLGGKATGGTSEPAARTNTPTEQPPSEYNGDPIPF